MTKTKKQLGNKFPVKEAVKIAEEYIQSFTPKGWGEFEIIYWSKGPWGFRIAELSWVKTDESGRYTGGSSLMQCCTKDCGWPIYAVERYVLHLMEGMNFDDPTIFEDLLEGHKEDVKQAILNQ